MPTESNVHYLIIRKKTSGWEYEVADHDHTYSRAKTLAAGTPLQLDDSKTSVMQFTIQNWTDGESTFWLRESQDIANDASATFHIGSRDSTEELWNIAKKGGDPVFSVKQPPPTGSSDHTATPEQYFITYKNDNDWKGGPSQVEREQRALSTDIGQKTPYEPGKSDPDGIVLKLTITNKSGQPYTFTATHKATLSSLGESDVEIGHIHTSGGSSCTWGLYTSDPDIEVSGTYTADIVITIA